MSPIFGVVSLPGQGQRVAYFLKTCPRRARRLTVCPAMIDTDQSDLDGHDALNRRKQCLVGILRFTADKVGVANK
jgi:hypothetical protein